MDDLRNDEGLTRYRSRPGLQAESGSGEHVATGTKRSTAAGACNSQRPFITASAARPAARHFRRDFMDAPRWAELARNAALRLPKWATRPTPRRIIRYARRLNLCSESGVSTGFRTWAQAIRRNPDWPLRAWVGLFLEEWAAGQGGAA